jgi:hypothetical protein
MSNVTDNRVARVVLVSTHARRTRVSQMRHASGVEQASTSVMGFSMQLESGVTQPASPGRRLRHA